MHRLVRLLQFHLEAPLVQSLLSARHFRVVRQTLHYQVIPPLHVSQADRACHPPLSGHRCLVALLVRLDLRVLFPRAVLGSQVCRLLLLCLAPLDLLVVLGDRLLLCCQLVQMDPVVLEEKK